MVGPWPGLGTVGLGVFRRMQRLPEDFEVGRGLVNKGAIKRPADIPDGLLTTRWQVLLESRPDIVIEVIGGTWPHPERTWSTGPLVERRWVEGYARHKTLPDPWRQPHIAGVE